MFWIKKGFLFAFFMFVGCGFRPVYYTQKNEVSFDEKTASVRIEPIPEEIGRICVQELKNNLNPEGKNVPQKYVLQVSLIKREAQDEGILEDNTATRATMTIVAKYTLSEISTGKKIIGRSVSAVSSYNILRANPYATITTAQATEKTLVKNVADQIALHVTEKMKKE